MSVLSLERIEGIRSDPARRTQRVSVSAIDRSKPFLPEDQTQLFYTPGYAHLNIEQRRRYNQLFGLRVNEYIMMLERDFVEPVLCALRERAARFGGDSLEQALESMREEEARHYEGFVELNKRCEPGAYEKSDFWFMRLRSYERCTLRIMQVLTPWLPFALWIIIAMEESSIGLATAMLRAGDTELGPIEPNYLAVHREHAKDEARHIHIDVHLVRACLHSFPAGWRAVNAKMFMAFMRDMTAPKAGGTGARVVHQLVTEFSDLARYERELVAGLVALRDHAGFQHSVFNRRLNPLAFALYDEEPALANLGHDMKAYERR